ncbi:MAG: SDR family oxidoreductase [Oscillospiraceae bacterium]|nr:SDR family oxidoreductase [Oscillospiraceae bacterium]
MVKTPPIESMSGAFDVKGKNVVVTGGNRGIGLGISTAFAQSGANVAVLCRNEASGKEVAEGFSQYGGKHTCIQCDVADYDSVVAAGKKVYEFFGHVDVLVNNAGIGSTTNFFAENGLNEWHRIINTNLHGVANVVHTIVPNMKSSGKGGTIINISSVGGQRVSNSREHDNSPYNASKAGLDIFSKYLALTLGDFGIRVNSLAPGMTHSDLDKDLPPAAIEMAEAALPTHRFAEPIEIGALCVFLSSQAGCHITGTVIVHDGGLMTMV